MTVDETGLTPAEKQAYMMGRRDSDVDRTLQSHSNAISRINGSIEKHALNAEKLRRTMDERCDQIEEKIDKIISVQGVQDALAAAAQQQRSLGFSRLQTWAVCLGVAAAVAVPILSAFIAAGKLF